MDPLSVASGVAGLVTLADVVISRTYNTIIACRHASEDSRKLLREVQALAGILQSLSSLEHKLGAAALQSHIPAAQIFYCQQTLQNIRDKLEKSDPKENGISIFQKAKRTLKWPLAASDTEKFLVEMERHKSTFDLALSVDALDAILSSQHVGERTDTKINQVVQALDRLCKIENTKEQRRILQLIGAGDADQAYRANLKLHQHGTGRWFLEEGKPFSTWLATPSSKLWVYGIPGAGKTILSALAISKIAESTSTTHGLAFYYCSHRDKQSRELAGILACLVGQLARQNMYCMSLLEGLREFHEHASAQAWMRNNDELDVMLRKMIRQFSSVSIVIDGVDECHESTLVTDTLASLARENLGMRIVIFSRKEVEMEPLLESYTGVSIAAESEDLRLYVPAQIEARTRLRKLRIKDPNVKDEIIETLVNGADGMFRWVACQLDHLCDLATDDERLCALKRLPRTLESTYDRILERVIDRGESICALVQRSLIWIIGGNDIEIRELCEAVSIDVHTTSLDPRKLIDADEILISCSSLIRISVDNKCLESAHFTVVEYLRGIDPIRQTHLARFRICDDLMYSHMAETSLTALAFDDVKADNMRDSASLVHWLRGFPFYYHAVTSWVGYYHRCQRTASIAALTQKLFLGSETDHYQVWAHLYLLHWQHPGRGKYNFTGLDFDAMFRSTDHADSSTGLQYTSEWTKALCTAAKWSRLRFAACLHQEHILAALLESTETLNDPGFVGAPLHLALLGVAAFEIQMNNFDLFKFAKFRSQDCASSSTVKALLDLGADVNVKYPLSNGKEVATALIASMTGHLEDAIAAGAFPDKETADWLFIHGGKHELELIASIDVNQITERDRPAVILLQQKFARSSGIANCQLGSHPTSFTDTQNKFLPEYVKVLEGACADDDLTVVQWLFETSGVSFDDLYNGEAILHTACTYSSASIVAYLVAQGVQIGKVADNGNTPLGSLLCHWGEPEPSTPIIMKLLLEAGANVYALDKDENTSLFCWARKECSSAPRSQCGMQNILDIILSFQHDLVRVNRRGGTVWHALAGNRDGHRLLAMLEAVVAGDELHASLDVADEYSLTPLHVAIQACNEQMLQFFIASGSSLTTKTPNGDTALDLATSVLVESHIPFQIMLKAGRHTARDGSQGIFSGDTVPDPIMDVVRTGDLDRLKSFVAAGGDLNTRFRSCNCMPVTVALMASQVAVFEYLHNLGVTLGAAFCELHYPGCALWALGLLAAQSAMLQPLQTMLASVEMLAVEEFTHMMHSAAANGNLEALKLLLATKQRIRFVRSGRYMTLPICRFWDFNQPSFMWANETVLHTAVQSGQRGSVQVLLETGSDLPDVIGCSGVPASHIAAQQGRDDIVELLLSHGGDVDARDVHMTTTLGSAIVTGHMNVVRLLVSRGADLSARDSQSQSLFQLASRNRKPTLFFALMEAGLNPTIEDIYSWYQAGQRQIWMASNHMGRLVVKPDFLLRWSATVQDTRAAFNLTPSHYRKLNLTCRCRVGEVSYTSLYNASVAGIFDIVKLSHDADAMLNLEGGLEGTPLMGACKAGRLEVVKYLVHNGAAISYEKNGVRVNAFNKAASYPKIQRWLLVERFIDQRMILDDETTGEQLPAAEEDDTWTDEIANVTLDLVLEDDVEQYLESKNWFLPMRRFVDDGQGAFVRVPILPEDFARYRPLGFKVSQN